MIREIKEPDVFLKEFWDLNQKYPEYVSCVRFDHASPPVHLMDQCSEIFRNKLESHIEKALNHLTQKIEICHEEGLSFIDFLNLRKRFRSYLDLDIAACKTVEELDSLFPSDLKEYVLKNLNIS